MSDRKDSPTYKITPDNSLCWIDEPYGIEIFFPDTEDEETEITCCCGKEGEMNYVEMFPIGTNLLEIQKWALDKMGYD